MSSHSFLFFVFVFRPVDIQHRSGRKVRSISIFSARARFAFLLFSFSKTHLVFDSTRSDGPIVDVLNDGHYFKEHADRADQVSQFVCYLNKTAVARH